LPAQLAKVFAEKISGAKADGVELAFKAVGAGDILVMTRLDRFLADRPARWRLGKYFRLPTPWGRTLWRQRARNPRPNADTH